MSSLLYMNTIIKQVRALEILDSRGNPTVRAYVTLADGSVGAASVPSGASTGTHEACELRDGGKRYGGKGARKAVEHVNGPIHKALKGVDALDQRFVDGVMINLDGTQNKKKLGANAILAVSLATARAASLSKKKPLYQYLRTTFRIKEKGYAFPLFGMNIINGGRHADNGLTVQEFMVMPLMKTVAERVRVGAEIFHALGGLLSKKGFHIGVGDEGGYAPELSNNEQAIQYIMQAIKLAGYVPGKQVGIALDVAASEFYLKGQYFFANKKDGISSDVLSTELQRLIKTYPFVSIEDPFAEDDWSAWAQFTKIMGKKMPIVGDDLFVTNVERLQMGIEKKAGNTILIKVNQIGTLTETMDTIALARKHGYKIFMSHRSGETGDTFISDLAVAVNAEYMKTGSLSRSERIEKYNRMLEIEDELT